MQAQNEYVSEVILPCRFCGRMMFFDYVISIVAVVTGHKIYNFFTCRQCKNVYVGTRENN